MSATSVAEWSLPFKILGRFQKEIRKKPSLKSPSSFIFQDQTLLPPSLHLRAFSGRASLLALNPHYRIHFVLFAPSLLCVTSLSGGQDLCFSSLCPLQFNGNTLNISCRTRCYRRGSHPACQDGTGLNITVLEECVHLSQPSSFPQPPHVSGFKNIRFLHPSLHF